MKISADYTAAPGDDATKLGPNEFTAGSILFFNCIVEPCTSDLTYSWSVTVNPETPDCKHGGCEIDTSSTTPILRQGYFPLSSYHAGVYTCVVRKKGSASFSVRVVGKYH